MKTLRMTFSDGTQWEIDAVKVADSRAKYFSNLDFERGDVTDLQEAYQSELEYTLNDETELFDWLHNNMDWSDLVELGVKQAGQAKANYAKEFTNCEAEIIESED